MRKLILVPLFLMVLALPTLVAAQEWASHETDIYTISYPSAWEDMTEAAEMAGMEEQGDVFLVTDPSGGMIPLTVMVAVKALSDEEMELSLEDLADQVVNVNNAELIEAGFEDMIDIAESASVSLNGNDAHHLLVNVSMMGLVISTDSYIMRHKDQFVTFAIMGEESTLAEAKEDLDAIIKSFRLN
ncbi:MAG: hypothetical protein GX122_08290 [Candidatus Cloacimonetes bacterium]|nr:hypothetical protein [Candidatus Cloacimonadota bacterium]NLO12401.1 hypothetical protein [Candidatus Cloacimonadota bacterium]